MLDLTEKMFNGPIPGQSLTVGKGERAYEQPPEFVDPVEAMFDLEKRITKPKKMRQLVSLMNDGMPLDSLAEMIGKQGVMDGKWTIDMAVIMAQPTLMLLMDIAERLGVNPTIKSADLVTEDEVTQTLSQTSQESPVTPEMQATMPTEEPQAPEEAPVTGSFMGGM